MMEPLHILVAGVALSLAGGLWLFTKGREKRQIKEGEILRDDLADKLSNLGTRLDGLRQSEHLKDFLTVPDDTGAPEKQRRNRQRRRRKSRRKQHRR